MNNHKLLSGLLCLILTGGGAYAYGQDVTTLEQIFVSAEANSAILRPCFTAETEADQEISVARAKRLPDINTSLNLSYIGDGFTTKRDFSDYQKASIPHFGSSISVVIEQPLYTGGAISGSIAMAELKSATQRFSTDLERDNLRIQLTGLYLDIFKYYSLREVIDNNIGSARKILDNIRARYDQGTVLMNDITRYELLLTNLEMEQIKINNLIDIVSHSLVTLAGLPDNHLIIPDTTMLDRALPYTDEDWWQKESQNNSSILKIANNNIEISKTAQKLANSERLPKIGIQAGWNLDGPILVEIPPINRNLSYWFVGVGLNYNFAALYKSNKAVIRSHTATLKAREELESQKEQLNIAIHTDFVKYMEAYEELKVRDKSVELSDLNYHTTSTRYMEGMALITDMLDAANARLQAQQQLVDARIEILYSYYKLLFTSGTI